MIDNEKLAKYLRKRMETQDKVNTTFHLLKFQPNLSWSFGFNNLKPKTVVDIVNGQKGFRETYG